MIIHTNFVSIRQYQGVGPIKDGIARLSGGGIHRPWLKGPIHGIAVIKAPDLLRSLFYGRESDVFRFGIILWESWYRRSALNEENESSLESYEQLSYIILEGRRPNFEGKIINKLKLLIQRCWEKDPVDRPTARNILERLHNIRKDT
ncbi:dual specificity protein kinase shkC-like [Mytilus trossulus]|uniref:dual specificity protein kinase shkC-like n=1 Tax=Mytilus trossulus TaxID=6551 RepID=UPI003006204C